MAPSVVALVGGVVTSAAFPPVGLPVFAVVGPAIGLWAAAHAGTTRRGALTGLLYGLGFSYATFAWLVTLDLFAYLLFSSLQALYWIPVGIVAARTVRLGPTWWTVAVAATWTLVEGVRARAPLSGFEWGQLGLATADSPVRQGAALVGTLGVTALLAALAAGVAGLVLYGRPRRWRPAVSAVTLLVAVTAVGAVPWTRPAGTLDAAVVQVADPCPDAFAADCPGFGERLLEQYAAQTAAVDTPEVVVWGEDGLGGAPSLETAGQRLVDAVGSLPAPVLAGTTTWLGDGQASRWNTLYDRSGVPVGTYAKRVPVPFGEYVPLRDLLGGISDVGRLVPLDILPGDSTDPVVVPTDDGPVPLGTVVSWEVTFSRLVRDVAEDAVGLATLTTVASYGTGSVSDQLLGAAQLRAAELQKPMVVGATTGRSAFVAPDGARVETSALFAPDRIRGQMDLRAGLTPFARVGDVPVLVIAGAAAAAVWLRARRTRRTGVAAPHDDPAPGPDHERTTQETPTP